MSDTDLQVALMEAGRMNLMHLPPGAIAWLWDRPTKQIDAAEDLAVAANANGNPIVDASLLKADQNVLLIKCQGGECFRVYPDGGYSFEDTPMDIGGCSAVMGGLGGPQGGAYDEFGHAMDPSPGDGYNDAMDAAEPVLMASVGYDEVDPGPGEPSPEDMTNLAGEPTMDEDLADDDYGGRIAKVIQDACGSSEGMEEDQGGDFDGPALGDGMGTGSPYVGQLPVASEQLDNMLMSRELGEFRIRDLDEDELKQLAESIGIGEI